MERTATQCAAILDALKAGRTITPVEALNEFGCFRLAARVFDLRRAGYQIDTFWITDGDKRFAEYRLMSFVRQENGRYE